MQFVNKYLHSLQSFMAVCFDLTFNYDVVYTEYSLYRKAPRTTEQNSPARVRKTDTLDLSDSDEEIAQNSQVYCTACINLIYHVRNLFQVSRFVKLCHKVLICAYRTYMY